jgi:hypothetical protein
MNILYAHKKNLRLKIYYEKGLPCKTRGWL